MPKVALGMSGGVDSSVAAVLLKNNGFNVLGVTMRLFDTEPLPDGALTQESINAKLVCDSLKIDHAQLDLRKEFSEKIVDYFVNEYIDGGTPNPCVVCNKQIKFGLMQTQALSLGCDFTATGHYAKKEQQGDRFLIKKAADISKDQSYMLFNMTQDQLAHTILPLAELTKAEIRSKADEAGLAVAHKSDSQDICFVPDGDYAAVIARLGVKSKQGNFVHMNGTVLGKHKGQLHYTIGQRKGLGIRSGSVGKFFLSHRRRFVGTYTTDVQTFGIWNGQPFERFVLVRSASFYRLSLETLYRFQFLRLP